MDSGSRGHRGGQPCLGGSRRRSKNEPVQTALSNTTLSGYVDIAINMAMSQAEHSIKTRRPLANPFQGGIGNTDTSLQKQMVST